MCNGVEKLASVEFTRAPAWSNIRIAFRLAASTATCNAVAFVEGSG